MTSDPVKEIKEKLDIVDVIREYIPINQAGRNYKAICPFHKEKTPSFVVSPERQTWRCFGQCNEGGDVISFVMKYENVEFYDALKILADKAGINIGHINTTTRKESNILEEINKSAKDFFISMLEKNKNAKDYFLSRKIKQETINDFELGFSPMEKDETMVHLTNLGYSISDIEKSGLIFKTKSGTYMDRFRERVIFPIHNKFGTVVGFSGRILPEYDTGKAGKYINSPETPIYHKSKILYGYNLSKKQIRETRTVIIVEGNFDMIMLWQDGVKNAVAISGTALTKDHLNMLNKVADNFIFAFDNDSAGSEASERAVDMANEIDVISGVLLLEDFKDIADFIAEKPGRIKDYIKNHTYSSKDFYFKKYLESFDNKKDSEKKKIIRRILEKINIIKSPIEKDRWIKGLSERTKINENIIREELQMLFSNRGRESEKQKKEENKKHNILEDFSSRHEKLAVKILKLAIINQDIKKEIEKNKIYFPEKLSNIIDLFVSNNLETAESDVKDFISYIDMSASLEDINEDKAYLEAEFLIKELIREFYKEKVIKIQEQIKEAEISGNEEKEKELLKEFDEITKLINTN